MSDLVKILPGENKYLSVTWQVNNFCNYKCSYCNEGNWSGTHKNNDTEKYIRFLDKLITRFQHLMRVFHFGTKKWRFITAL